MSRKKLLVLLAITCLALVLQYAILSLSPNTRNTNQTPLQNSPPEGTNPPELVVPEVPLGTLGLFSALVLGLGVFVLKRRER